ncbi:MAG: FAD:protein FMN transferase [Acidobacteriota bacterium]|nr:FAD:protein FMN transferase [Acidobacteriota bacterium]
MDALTAARLSLAPARRVLWLVPCALALALTALQAPVHAQPAPQRFHQSHPAMGTIWTIDLYASDQATAQQQMDAAFDEIDRIEDLLSNYKPSSELSRISRDAANGPVVTDPETFGFLQRSLYWSRVSGGAFDLTVGPLLRAWGFFFHQGRVPAPAELQALRPAIGWQHIQLDAATRSVLFRHHRPMELDPGSIGKGFAIDSAVALLRSQGVTSAFLSAGGSTFYAIGTIPGQAGWPVEVPDPQHPGRVAASLLLRDTSMSTGACTQKFFIYQGHRYCHIFDPIAMRPVEGVLQSTVIDPSATDSDALSTVVFVLSAAATRQLLHTMPAVQSLVFRQRSADDPDACSAIHWRGNPCDPHTLQTPGAYTP